MSMQLLWAGRAAAAGLFNRSGLMARGSLAVWATACGLLLAGHAAPANAQFKLQQGFAAASAPGWTLSYDAILTAPSVDPVGQGWLRLTNLGFSEKGQGLNTGASFSSSQAVVVKFSYVSWGGTGADGITVFLYDATQNMSGATVGGGLGFCGGAGGYLAIGLDEYGNFSNPGDNCGGASGGPGAEPESLVIRGPMSANNAYVTGVAVSGGIDNPGVATRPSAKTVVLTLTPASLGYTITARFQSADGQPFQTLFSNVSFPYAPPANLSVGFGGSSGGSTNFHELRGLVTSTPADLQVMMTGPSSILQGTQVTYTVVVTNNGSYAIGASDAPTVGDTLPTQITGAAWTCTPSSGATCLASGSGDINTSALTLPVNGSATYTITGTVDPNLTCGTTATNSAHAEFDSASTFTDPDESNNTSSVVSTVSCAVTLIANPTTLSFGPQTVNLPSSARAITITGTNGALISSITTTGDYSQTNDCTAALAGATSCTVNIVYTPSAEGSSTGTLTITSSAASSPTMVALSGTGTNATPDSFALVALNNVDPSSAQVSNAITVAGTNISSTISVSSGAEYSINGGAFTSEPGVVPPGAQIEVRVTASSAYSTSVSAVLTIGGVDSTFTVTTREKPASAPPPAPPPAALRNVTVTSGGGALAPWALLALGLIATLRIARQRRVPLALLGVALALGMLHGNRVEAAETDYFASTYVGIRAGDATTTLTAGELTRDLEAKGYDVEASDVRRTNFSGSIYAGYELGKGLAVELGWTYLGRTRTSLQGTEPASLEQLLHDASRITRGGGDAFPLVARYRLQLAPRVALDLRAGPYLWSTHSRLWVGPSEEFSRTDRGLGFTVGAGPHIALGRRFSLGVGVDYFRSTADNRFLQAAATLDYRLH